MSIRERLERLATVIEESDLGVKRAGIYDDSEPSLRDMIYYDVHVDSSASKRIELRNTDFEKYDDGYMLEFIRVVIDSIRSDQSD